MDYSSLIDNMSLTLDDVANDGRNCPGAACEGDNIHSDVEGVFTGAGNDHLVGNDGPQTFGSGEGNDVVQAVVEMTFSSRIAGPMCSAVGPGSTLFPISWTRTVST
jgi:hypothetical protein